jgi:hypothetical protein
LCDCHNRQTALEVNAEFETWRLRQDYDEAETITELGHRVIPWLCFSGIVGVLAAIIIWGA